MTLKKTILVFTACGALLSFGGVASAQTDTVTEKGGPSRAMLFSGLGTFGISYGAAALVAAVTAAALTVVERRRRVRPVPRVAGPLRAGVASGTP